MSSTLKSKQIATYRKNNNLSVYNFGLGENPLNPPDYFVDMVKQFSHKKSYSSSQGIPIFQETIKKLFSSDKYIVNNVLTGNGLKELIFLVQMAFDGKIIHITPSWVSYKEQVKILKKENNLIKIDTKIENNFKVLPEVLESTLKKYKDQNKLLIFNNPNNPTGVSYTTQEIKEIARILDKYNTIVLADEIYLNLTYVDKPDSISTYIPHLTLEVHLYQKI